MWEAWAAESGLLLAELKGHTDGVRSAEYTHDGLRIVTASQDRTARVWNMPSEKRTAKKLAKRIRSDVSFDFETEDSDHIVFRMPTPAECHGGPEPNSD